MDAERMRRIAGVALGLAAAGAVAGGVVGLLFVSWRSRSEWNRSESSWRRGF